MSCFSYILIRIIITSNKESSACSKDTDNDIALVQVKSPGFVLNEYVNVVALASDEPNGEYRDVY